MIEVPDFDALYRSRPDPWRVGSSFYERRKRDLLLAALQRPRYGRAWDPACGTGHLAARLAERCDSVVATDLAGSAVDVARATCRHLDNVDLHRRTVPDDGAPPNAGKVDLLVLAEFCYYLDDGQREGLVDLVHRTCRPDAAGGHAEVVVLHWRHKPHDGWLSGEAVNRQVTDALTALGWRRAVRIDDPEFVLDGLRREPGNE